MKFFKVTITNPKTGEEYVRYVSDNTLFRIQQAVDHVDETIPMGDIPEAYNEYKVLVTFEKEMPDGWHDRFVR